MYKDPIIEKLIEQFQENLTKDDGDLKKIKTYYHGDPLMIPKDNLPAICLTKDVTRITDESNAEDSHKINVYLTLVIDIRNFVEDDMADVNVAESVMWDIIEGRNEDFTLRTDTLLYILRNGVNLGNNAHVDAADEVVADYGYTIGKRGEKSYAVEAYIKIPVFVNQFR